MNYKNAIVELKKMTLVAKDFHKCMEYFLDHIGENDLALAHGKKYRNNEFYQTLLTPIMQTHFDDEVKISGIYLFKISKSNFVHGTAMLTNGVMPMLYYFEDTHVGMVAISNIRGYTNFYRLTGFVSDRSPEETIIPSSLSRAMH